jgi:hypothetical protein
MLVDESEMGAAAHDTFAADFGPAAIELVEVYGERAADGVATQSRFGLTAEYMRQDADIHYRYNLTAHFTDDFGTAVGRASVSVLVIIRIADGTDAAYIEKFGATSAALVARPYLRDAISSTAERIGFPGILPSNVENPPKS